jgi:two-component system phosphate regulon sensor histidine kinase PhoR
VAKKVFAIELLRLEFILVLALITGVLLDELWLSFVIGCALYVAYHLWQLYKLSRWLVSNKASDAPHSSGLWEQVLDGIYKLREELTEEEENVKAAADNMYQALSALTDAVVLIDANGNIEWSNSAATVLLGVRFPEAKGGSLFNFLDDMEFSKFIRSGNYADGIEMAGPQNSYLTLKIELSQFGEGHRLLFARNLTKIKRLERMREDFVANVSHELRTPLTVINGYLETLNSLGVSDNPNVNKALSQMQTQSTRMSVLVEDLMLLAQLDSVSIEADDQVIDISSLVEHAVTDMKVSLAADKTITVKLNNNLFALGQEKELNSVVINLISNACKYTPSGGVVEISWQLTDIGAEFRVTDTGIGIAPEHITRLTERFYRVDKSRSIATGGTGLGLAIVKHVLIRHDSHLNIKSSLGESSTFSFNLSSKNIHLAP